MTPEHLAKLNRLVATLPPEPWQTDRTESDDPETRSTCRSVSTPEGSLDGDNPIAIAEFFAAARSAVPALIAEVERLHKALRAIEAREAGRPAWYRDGDRWWVTPFTYEQMEGSRLAVLRIAREAL